MGLKRIGSAGLETGNFHWNPTLRAFIYSENSNDTLNFTDSAWETAPDEFSGVRIWVALAMVKCQ